MNFISKDDHDYFIMSNDRLRDVCSSIECEMELCDDLDKDENENLQELIKSVKKLIKEHRKSRNALEDGTYNVIHGSLNHWSMSNARKIELLCDRFFGVIDNFCIIRQIKYIKDDIHGFVKYRNDITHGKYRILDQNVVEVAFILEAVVYACVLKRIGFDDDYILKLFSDSRVCT